MRGCRVCRMHGARGGAPSGKGNGNYRHGTRTKEAIASSEISQPVVALCAEILRKACWPAPWLVNVWSPEVEHRFARVGRDRPRRHRRKSHSAPGVRYSREQHQTLSWRTHLAVRFNGPLERKLVHAADAR